MDTQDEAVLVVLDALAAGPRSAEELRRMCDFDVTGVLDGWDAIARGPGGEARAERLLTALSRDADGPVGFAARLDHLVECGWIARGDAGYSLTPAGEAHRRAFD